VTARDERPETLTAADMTAAERAAWDVAVARGLRITRADLRALLRAAAAERAGRRHGRTDGAR
jgi:hypothetical protein